MLELSGPKPPWEPVSIELYRISGVGLPKFRVKPECVGTVTRLLDAIARGP